MGMVGQGNCEMGCYAWMDSVVEGMLGFCVRGWE
jgi:hypothetical protein